MTSWQAIGPAAVLGSKLDLGPAWQPRSMARLSQLQLQRVRTEFDFAGVLLWAGECIQSGREHTQWIFLAAETDAEQQQQQQQQQGASSAAAQAAAPPAVLAVKLVGTSPTCIDWLEPSTISRSSESAAAPTGQQQLAVTPGTTDAASAAASLSTASSTGSVHTRTATRRLAVAHQQSNQQQQGSKDTVVYCRNLILQRLDHANHMWVAAAPDTAELAVAAAGKGSVGGAAAAARVTELRSWAGQQQQLLGVLRAHVQRLVGVS
ncbi:hypothetical protein COO60DRAFT_848316 [Scenedesmus sp. NREL 46B-D3]|nr:hypothetical protein COO60DRAFT_848316 [Scenedesmus sp. NREL 46B-D3]